MLKHTTTARPESFLNWLNDKSAIDQNTRSRVLTALRNTGETVDKIILEFGILTEDILADELAAFLGLDRVMVEQLRDDPAIIPKVSQKFLLDAGLLPLAVRSGQIHLATAHPLDDAQAKAAAYFSGLELVLMVATPSCLNRKFAELREAPPSDFANAEDEQQAYGEGDAEKLRDLASEAPVVRLLSHIVGNAVEQQASDIHFEPVEQKLLVRFRIDGVLRVTEKLDIQSHLALVSRIKILARLNIAEQRLPQDGRIRLAIRGKNIDFRVATSPTVGGETVVLRILDRRDVALDFSALGFSDVDQVKLQRILQHRNGIVLVTGPTGSGKTTTLYAALNLLNKPETKIFTVEDPVEYQIAGVNQIPVRSGIGLDFANILRSVLRQDPDIIMIGEIRDSETARIAVQASLTGHLVLSTAHTNSAVAAITRLRDLGIENYLLATTIRAIIAQRLVRKICNECDGETKSGVACRVCQGTGYSGRTSTYEILEFTQELQNATAGGKDDIELLKVAQEKEFVDIAQHGKALVRAGITSRSEVSRAVTATEL